MNNQAKRPFSQLTLKPELLHNLESLGYYSMTDIQAESLPPILNGKDVIARGKTGSGKTAAFALGMLQKLDVKRFRVQSLVLCPTRELADQVAQEIRRIARTIHNIKVLTLCGGTAFGPQIGSLQHGAHIVVGTPGRVEEHVRKRTLKLEDANLLILDEADRMLEMGFAETLEKIIEQVSSERQTLLFSATYPEKIENIAKRIMREPELIETKVHEQNQIQERFYKLREQRQRGDVLRLILQEQQPESAVVFCNTKREVNDVAEFLLGHGFNAQALQGDMEQRDRDRTLALFANKTLNVLVATDVAARGLDIDRLDLVINYHIARDSEVHTHRIGRTGRAGSQGLACSIYHDKEQYKITMLGEYLGKTITPVTHPHAKYLERLIPLARMCTLQIDAGKKQKLRAGDILGALTSKGGIAGSEVGKINLFDNHAYVAVDVDSSQAALRKLEMDGIKGRKFRSWRVRL